MRLLISLPDCAAAHAVAQAMEWRGWDACMEADGMRASAAAARFDLWLLHECLPGAGGRLAVQKLLDLHPLCPPRIVYVSPPEYARPAFADCILPPCAGIREICSLLEITAQKPLPKLAAASRAEAAGAVEQFLLEVALPARLKGRGYAAWMLERMVLSPAFASMPVQTLYRCCAAAFQTTESNVERCLRSAVEILFTHGSMAGIERYFGATVDPERGKPTNRAFLTEISIQLRHSLTLTRSLNKSVMHQSPAAPTSV